MANQHDDVVVAADGSGNYTTVTAAAPANSDKERGVYKEFVVLGQEKRNVVLVGDGMDATVISGSRCCAGWLHHTRHYGVQGKGFIARDLCIENTAGPRKEKGQAVALLSRSDQSVLYRCALRGYQDTLWCARSSKQLSRECTITGTVDFIFGEAAAVFQGCTLLARLPILGQENTITAQGLLHRGGRRGSRRSRRQGYRADLPRPPVEAVLARGLHAEHHLRRAGPQGLAAVGAPQVPPDTLYYAEYKNGGPGAAVSGRVNWRGVHANLDASTARSFTVEKLINGNDWLPSTGVEYKPGL
ncbi:hypothetical protein SETIT_2G263400v2 [Setaria italica]|uniref:Pectinesterase n=1 Tax=Setaria italica TaxID=4555 RepID=A0A368Q3I3_SETIT|nr:hypothetical protein SETIT_2G263400v2 [Setaria italica]